MTSFRTILLTGAAGALGSALRPALAPLANTLRISDRIDLSAVQPNEEAVHCDLSDFPAVLSLTKDVDAIVHMGGIGLEDTFARIRDSNITGLYNVYEGARQNGVKRIVWPSSNHAVGFYGRTTMLDVSCTTRPDSLYGVSKVFGEGLAQYYFDKFGIETLSMRIGSCFPKPINRRMLATWLSYADLAHLVHRGLLSPKLDHTIVYGVSKNDELLWDNRQSSHLGYHPQDNAEAFRSEIEAATPVPNPSDPLVNFHGGDFAGAGHFEDLRDGKI